MTSSSSSTSWTLFTPVTAHRGCFSRIDSRRFTAPNHVPFVPIRSPLPPLQFAFKSPLREPPGCPNFGRLCLTSAAMSSSTPASSGLPSPYRLSLSPPYAGAHILDIVAYPKEHRDDEHDLNPNIAAVADRIPTSSVCTSSSESCRRTARLRLLLIAEPARDRRPRHANAFATSSFTSSSPPRAKTATGATSSLKPEPRRRHLPRSRRPTTAGGKP